MYRRTAADALPASPRFHARPTSARCRPRQLAPAAWAVLALAVLLAPGAALAQAHGDAAEGGKLTASWCSGCHQVDLRRRNSGNDAVPSFAAIAALPSTTTLSINAFLRSEHDVMPDYKLTAVQIDDVAAYITSLRGTQME